MITSLLFIQINDSYLISSKILYTILLLYYIFTIPGETPPIQKPKMYYILFIMNNMFQNRYIHNKSAVCSSHKC